MNLITILWIIVIIIAWAIISPCGMAIMDEITDRADDPNKYVIENYRTKTGKIKRKIVKYATSDDEKNLNASIIQLEKWNNTISIYTQSYPNDTRFLSLKLETFDKKNKCFIAWKPSWKN